MTDNKALVVVGLAIGGLYLYMRARGRQYELAHAMLPPGQLDTRPTTTNPSPLGMNPGGGTNPLTAILTGITSVFTKLASKGAGNAPASSSAPATVGISQLGWTLPPNANYIPPPPLNPSYGTAGAYLPNIGDPNFAQWEYLGNTMEGQTWYMPGAYIGNVPFDAPSAGGGIPDLSWTLDQRSLGYDPDYIPPPPQSGGISIVGITA